MNSRFLRLVVIVGLIAITGCYSKDLTPEKLKKSYQKINEYLLENVSSDEPSANMVGVEEMLKKQSSKSTFLGGLSLMTTLKMLSQLSTMPKDDNLCGTEAGLKLMEELDSGLADKMKAKTPNYPVDRVEKLISHYTMQNTELCFQDIRLLEGIVHAFKRHSYDVINAHLVEALPDEDDVYANMAEAEAHLNRLGPNQGALAAALRQLLKLKSTSDEATCNHLGYQILYRNDLATRGYAHSWADGPMRRVDKIYQHYAREHEQLCYDIFRKRFAQELKSLDPDTYRKVLALAISNYLTPWHLGQSMATVRDKQVNEFFAVPEMVDFAKQQLAIRRTYASLAMRNKLHTKQIHDYVMVMSSQDEDGKYLEPKVNERSGTKVINEQRFEQLLNNYVFNPCRKFMGVFGDLVEADEFDGNQNEHHFESLSDKFIDELTYHTVRAAHASCRYVLSDKQTIMADMKNRASGIMKPWKFRGAFE